MSKKVMGFVVMFCGLVALGCIFICFGLGISTNQFPLDLHAYLYDLTFGQYMVLGVLIAWIVLVAATVASLAGGLLMFLKSESKIGNTLAMAGAALMIVAGILYFCTHIFASATFECDCGLQVASIFNGILLCLFGLISGAVAFLTNAAAE